MTHFETLTSEQLLEIKGGANELTQRDSLDEAIV